MSKEHISFGKKVFNNTTFALLDIVLSKISTTIAFVILVHLLPESDIAVIGIGAGYLVLIAYLDVGPIRVLLRDYPKIVQDRETYDQFLTALFSFWGGQALGMILLCLGLNYFIFSRFNLPGLFFLFLGLVIDFIALTFQDWLKTIFYADFKQAKATKISFYLTLIRFISYAILFWKPSLSNYSWILIATSVINCGAWAVAFKRQFDYKPVFGRHILVIIRSTLDNYGLWDHLNRGVIDTLFTIDTVILSFFVSDQLQSISDYTIALKFTSLFFLIPMQIHRSLQVVLANYNDKNKHMGAINTFLKVNFLVSFGQLLFVFVGGNWLLHLLFGADIDPNVYKYVVIISTGITIINLTLPLWSIINNFCNLRRSFFKVFFPSLIIGLGVYVILALFWGTIGIAYGNIIVYAILAFGLVLFTFSNYSIPLKLRLISREEKDLIYELLRGKN